MRAWASRPCCPGSPTSRSCWPTSCAPLARPAPPACGATCCSWRPARASTSSSISRATGRSCCRTTSASTARRRICPRARRSRSSVRWWRCASVTASRIDVRSSSSRLRSRSSSRSPSDGRALRGRRQRARFPDRPRVAERRARAQPEELPRQARPPRLLDLLRSEEHTSELQSLAYLVCRLLLEKKKYATQVSAEDNSAVHSWLHFICRLLLVKKTNHILAHHLQTS